MPSRSDRWRGLVDHVLSAPAVLSEADRRAIFDAARDDATGGPADLSEFVGAVARHAYRVTDRQVEDLLASGRSEDELYEAAVVSAMGAGERRLRAALETMGRA